MLNVTPVGAGAVFVEAMAMTALLFGTCEVPYQMLSRTSPGIFSDIFNTTVLKYSLSVRNFSLSYFYLGEGSGCVAVGRRSALKIPL